MSLSQWPDDSTMDASQTEDEIFLSNFFSIGKHNIFAVKKTERKHFKDLKEQVVDSKSKSKDQESYFWTSIIHNYEDNKNNRFDGNTCFKEEKFEKM